MDTPVHHSPVRHNAISGQAHGPVLQAGAIHGGVHLHQAPHVTPRSVPRQLKPPVAHFTNRRRELATMGRIAAADTDTHPVLVVLYGTGGVGKTGLALQWLHQAADSYPDGQLYADLATGPERGPMAAISVLTHFLRALGVPGEHIPVCADDAAALFRTVTAGRRIAVLLDNAVSAAQVQALLPSSPASTVVVTTRWRLAGLAMAGAAFVPVQPLPRPEGAQLLARMLGADRTQTQSEAVAGLVDLCAGLPIALSIAGAQLAVRPEWPVSQLVQQLADERRRLTTLAMEGTALVDIFNLSYRYLSSEAARAYRLLGLLPGPDFSIEAAAAVIQQPVEETRYVVAGLVDACLLEETNGASRYRFHDLVRLHAREHAGADGGEAVRHRVVGRLLEHYLVLSRAASQAVAPLEWHLAPAVDPHESAALPDVTGQRGLQLLERDLPNLMAALEAGAECGLDQPVWQLAEAMWPLFLLRKHFPEWMATYRLGIEAATRCGDHAARSRMHHHLGFAHHNLGRADEALQHGEAALAAARGAGHDQATAEAVSLIGMAHRSAGRPHDAIGVLREAVELDHRAGRVRGEALGLRRLGQALVDAGMPHEAIGQLERSRDLAASLPDSMVQAMTMVWLADALTRTGRAAEAAGTAREALEVLRYSGSDQYQAQALMVAGEAAEQMQETETARQLLRQARAFYKAAGALDLRRVDHALGRVEAAQP
ncbi:ATP-binding protein [Streptomyces sp. NRRL F-5053]|uniref:ATP-binding protein n=1 Tax=Streptomyces sp. NRRL F-5053 TaxID=1463854 RepID=UPI00068B3A06|nr:tetratricopeptide repeat protein [Streptomyces sp. NRRL F-5053]